MVKITTEQKENRYAGYHFPQSSLYLPQSLWWKVQQQNIHCVEDLVLRGLQEASKTVQAQDLIHRSEAAIEMVSNGGTHH